MSHKDIAGLEVAAKNFIIIQLCTFQNLLLCSIEKWAIR